MVKKKTCYCIPQESLCLVTAHVNVMNYREGGLTTASRKNIGNKVEFLPPLETICFLHECLGSNAENINLMTP